MRRLLKPFWILLALFFLVEAWLWDHLRPLVAAVVNVIAWDKLKARLAALVEWLPPWAVLIVFVIPFLVLLPLQSLEVYLIVQRQPMAAQASVMMLVMTAAEHSTMPIWNAAEANSKLWYLLSCRSRSFSVSCARRESSRVPSPLPPPASGSD